MLGKKSETREKGVALLVILFIVMTVTVISLGFLSRSDVELSCGQNMVIHTQMDYLAESGLEHAKGLILNPQDIASEYWTGATAQQLAVESDDYYDVNVVKLGECNYQITSKAYREKNGEQFGCSNLMAELRLDPCIAFWSGAGIYIHNRMNIVGDVYCDGALVNAGTIDGDSFANTLTGNAITGRLKQTADLSLNWPALTFSNLTGNYTKQVLPAGNLNAVVLNTSASIFYFPGDFTIKDNVVINRGLAINGNLIIQGSGNVITAAKNAPAVYVSGNLIINNGSGITINGITIVDGKIQMPMDNSALTVNGALFTKQGVDYYVTDYSSKTNNGTLIGQPKWAQGTINGCVNFDGVDDYINMGVMSNVIINTKLTVSANIKVNAFDRNCQAIVTRGDSSWRLQRYSDTNRIEFALTDTLGISHKVIGNINVNDGSWHHVVGVYTNNPGIMYLYVDGILDNSAIALLATIKNDGAEVFIGENSGNRGRYWNGLIDDVRVYNINLAQSDLANIQNITNNLCGNWKMDWANNSTNIIASPAKSAIYTWPAGTKEQWSPAADAFYKSIQRQ